jgi:alpha-1,2-glucosyltransferase
LAEGVRIALFPPLWFFGHLYYTDVGSVALILASWLASRRGRHLGASFVRLGSCCASSRPPSGFG